MGVWEDFIGSGEACWDGRFFGIMKVSDGLGFFACVFFGRFGFFVVLAFICLALGLGFAVFFFSIIVVVFKYGDFIVL